MFWFWKNNIEFNTIEDVINASNKHIRKAWYEWHRYKIEYHNDIVNELIKQVELRKLKGVK